MKVNICYRVKGSPGTYQVVSDRDRDRFKEMTVKEAKQYFNDYLKDDPNITEVWLRKFDYLNYRIVKTLKEMQ